MNVVNWHNENISEDMVTWHAIYIGSYVNKEYLKELVSGVKRNQMECLRMEMEGRNLGIRKIKVIPVMIGALGAISEKFNKHTEEFGVKIRLRVMQKIALLGAARILKKVLSL